MENKKYRVFPILFLAFMRVALGVAIGLAIPLYYLDIGLEPGTIGVITSGTAMSYLVSPLIFKNLHKKIGVKLTIILSCIGFLLIQITIQFTLEPFIVYILLILDGIVLGSFWPVLMTAVSTISKLEEYNQNDLLKDRLMKRYSLAWNFGGIFSFVLGTIVLFFIENILLMFIFSLLIATSGLIFAFLIQEPENNLDKEIIVPIDERVKNIPNREDISFPVFLPLVMICVYGFLIGGLGLAYPIKSELLNFPLFTNYLFYFFRMSTQTATLSKTMDLTVKKIKRMILVSNIIVIVSFISMGLNYNIIIFGILFCLFGSFIFKNIAKNTSKYSVYFEIMIGIGFFLAPILTGLIAELNADLTFFFLAILSVFTFIVYLIFYRKIKE
ncbi:MAG: MFS transporter [Promethearchaeota archaeon]|jgi:MFS family permease